MQKIDYQKELDEILKGITVKMQEGSKKETLLLHVQLVPGATRLKTAIDAETVQVESVPAVGVAVDGEDHLLGQSPFAGRLGLVGHVVAVVVEVMTEVAALIPLAEELRRNRVHAKSRKSLGVESGEWIDES